MLCREPMINTLINTIDVVYALDEETVLFIVAKSLPRVLGSL